MKSLLNIVKEQGIVDIIAEYKREFERVDIMNKLEIQYEKLSVMKKVKENRLSIVRRCSEVDEDGQYHYADLLTTHLSNEITKIRKEIMKLQIEKFLIEEEEVIEIGSDSNTIDIGTTGSNYDMGATSNDDPYFMYTNYN